MNQRGRRSLKMKNQTILMAVLLAAGVLLAIGPVVYAAQTSTFYVANSRNDGMTNKYNGATSANGTTAFIGKDYIMGWRFENVSIPKGAIISSAILYFYCYTNPEKPISTKFSGENVDHAAPITTAQNDLINRGKTSAKAVYTPNLWVRIGWKKSSELAPIVQEIVNRAGWASGNALLLMADDFGSTGYRTLSTFDMNASYGAQLTVTYSPPPAAKCEFDTNRDGIPDIVLYDTDGDGYFELPAGKVEYNGTLVIDKPIEIVWNPNDPGQTGVLLKGHALNITDGGKIVSELVLHNGSIANPGLTNLGFSADMTNNIELEWGAEIVLGGKLNGAFDGDILLKTTRPYSKIFLQGDPTQENTWLYGRNVTITSGGSIYITDKLWVEANAKVTLEAPLGDINLSRGSTIWAGRASDIIFKAGTPETPTTPVIIGNLNISGEAELAGSTINMCGVTGTKNDDGTTSVIGTKVCW
jgi:hypothetical protein